MVSFGIVTAPVGVSFSMLIYYNERIMRLEAYWEVRSSTILGLVGSNRFMSYPVTKIVPFFHCCALPPSFLSQTYTRIFCMTGLLRTHWWSCGIRHSVWIVCVCVCWFVFSNLREREKCSLKALIQKTLKVEWLYLHLNLPLKLPLIADVTLTKLSNPPEPMTSLKKKKKEVLSFYNSHTSLA